MNKYFAVGSAVFTGLSAVLVLYLNKDVSQKSTCSVRFEYKDLTVKGTGDTTLCMHQDGRWFIKSKDLFKVSQVAPAGISCVIKQILKNGVPASKPNYYDPLEASYPSANFLLQYDPITAPCYALIMIFERNKRYLGGEKI